MVVQARRAGAEVERDVEATLYRDVRFIAENIDVEVRGYAVSLRGSVPNHTQRARKMFGREKVTLWVIEMEIDSKCGHRSTGPQ